MSHYIILTLSLTALTVLLEFIFSTIRSSRQKCVFQAVFLTFTYVSHIKGTLTCSGLNVGK